MWHASVDLPVPRWSKLILRAWIRGNAACFSVSWSFVPFFGYFIVGFSVNMCPPSSPRHSGNLFWFSQITVGFILKSMRCTVKILRLTKSYLNRRIRIMPVNLLLVGCQGYQRIPRALLTLVIFMGLACLANSNTQWASLQMASYITIWAHWMSCTAKECNDTGEQ